ncbi:hypothetical protein NRK68_14720 [Streptomyces yangpuensis]|uniref:Uncharacterized protein n=1 Tax=Streptomyces yangpuensis TaxID=1648182 RepID=A0ABY5PWE5_9ACTN|nr:hypothetical protein [Streptomyces yangpuensis]MBZ9596456.1 hypothetical protein [Streptomyces erythrochromogenes]UUY48345.1 hypothetical protein NRK68_14720 [Streptomyces yangpuensis]
MPSLSSTARQNAGCPYGWDGIQATFSATSGFSGSFTWAALLAAVTLAVSVYFTVVHRRRDRRFAQLAEDYRLLDEIAVVLGGLEEITATKDDLRGLKSLMVGVRQAEMRFPEVPFGPVAAAIEAYEKTALSAECAKKLTKKLSDSRSVIEALERSRRQGARIADIRSSINVAQRAIERLLRR